jgi:hypothetical protein
MNPMIRKLDTQDIIPATALDWRVFAEFEAPEYSDEGNAEFKVFIEFEQTKAKLSGGEYRIWSAFDGTKTIGVIAIKRRCTLRCCL